MMSAIAFFNAARDHKREVTGNPTIGLTQSDVDQLNAVIQQWKPKPVVDATQLGDPAAFFAKIRSSLSSLTQPQVDGFVLLTMAMGKAGWGIAWAAYGLATAWHETAQTMQPIKERGGLAYFKKMYDIQGNRPEVAKVLGNHTPGDGAKYAGRGYVQLTGKTNYSKAAAKTGAPLLTDPDLAMRPHIASDIMVWGMQNGVFSGKKLSDYLPKSGLATQAQFTMARRIVNGQDRASDIAALAMKFQSALQAGQWA